MPDHPTTERPETDLRDAPAVEAKPDGDLNYAYWREHGGTWADEYDLRKRVQVYYHIQELMLAEYVAEHARLIARPFRVLEFGCGVGRHLRNLHTLPNVEAFGYDQSPTMVAGCLRWTGPAWLDEHVRIGTPTGRLPYDDDAFDLAYSSEVLVHVRPEHLDGVLSEMHRVAGGHVLHFEPAEHVAVCREAHHGCWRHDLPAAYERLGLRCETMGSGFRVQAPFRVTPEGVRTWVWPGWKLELWRRLDRDLDAGVAELRAARDAAAARAGTVEAGARTAAAIAAAARHEAAAAQRRAELDAHAARALAADQERRAAAAAEHAASLTDALRRAEARRADAQRHAEAQHYEADRLRAVLESEQTRHAGEAAFLRSQAQDATARHAAAVDMVEGLSREVVRLQTERSAAIQDLTRALGVN